MKPMTTLFLAILLCVPTSRLAAEVVVEKDIDYLGATRAEKLDLYRPAETPAGVRHPGIVIIHGGGWTGGDKGAAREQNIGINLAEHGYVCVSVNYLRPPPASPRGRRTSTTASRPCGSSASTQTSTTWTGSGSA